MIFNTILIRLGFDPNDFINEDDEPIKTKDGIIYEAVQRIDNRFCLYFKSSDVVINDYKYSEMLIDVGQTYKKMRIEIANGCTKNQTGGHYTNGIAESVNYR